MIDSGVEIKIYNIMYIYTVDDRHTHTQISVIYCIIVVVYVWLGHHLYKHRSRAPPCVDRYSLTRIGVKWAVNRARRRPRRERLFWPVRFNIYY